MWLTPLRVSEGSAHVRLIAFAHAGASASAYREWDLPSTCELYAVQLPGRGPRHSEPACTEMSALVEAVVEALAPTIATGMPFAFFGHSFGALVAAEVARALADRGKQLPLMLLLSAHPAPTVVLGEDQAALSQLPTDDALLDALRIWDFAPEALRGDGGAADAAMLAMTVPPIRADLAMREAHCARAAAAAKVEAPLPCALHVFGGDADRSCPPDALESWRPVAPAFSTTVLPGGHFYLEDAEPRARLLARIAALLADALAAAPVSVVSGGALPFAAAADCLYAHEMFERCAEVTPHATAIIEAAGEGGGGSGGGSGSGGDDAAVVRHSYADVRAAASGLAEWLRLHGAHPKTTVAMLLHHCASFLIGQLAIAMTGAACFALEGHSRVALDSRATLRR